MEKNHVTEESARTSRTKLIMFAERYGRDPSDPLTIDELVERLLSGTVHDENNRDE